METYYPRLGHIVKVKGRTDLYKVVYIARVNVRIEDELGKQFVIRYSGLVPASSEERDTFVSYADPVIKLVLGTAVRFTDAAAALKWPGTYVVIKTKQAGDCSVAKFGGDANRYVNTNARNLEIVNA